MFFIDSKNLSSLPDSSPEQIELLHSQFNHELQALDYFNSALSTEFNTSLLCIVDYKGFRVLASAETPTEFTSILYELQSEKPLVDQEIAIKFSKIGAFLHLKPHSVMLKDDRRVTISLASGVQASYDGKTGQVYLQDLYSMLPMDGKQTEITVKRLRPEFLADYPHPLCADAFTSWSATSKRERAENDEEVMQACAFLREHWIPAFVRKLDQLEIRPINSHELTRAFHDGGVNIRYLGEFLVFFEFEFESIYFDAKRHNINLKYTI